MEKPEVDFITGVPPTVAIEQRISRGGGKCTVATVTEVYHFLRLLCSPSGHAILSELRCRRGEAERQRGDEDGGGHREERRGSTCSRRSIKARKGFHTEVARWATPSRASRPCCGWRVPRHRRLHAELERFKEHTIDAVVAANGRVGSAACGP